MYETVARGTLDTTIR